MPKLMIPFKNKYTISCIVNYNSSDCVAENNNGEPRRALTKKLVCVKMERVSQILQLPIVIERCRPFCLDF
jgi:hypothetical protein